MPDFLKGYLNQLTKNNNNDYIGRLEIEEVAGDGGFISLKLLSNDSVCTEVFIDQSAIRLVSKKSKSAILLNTVTYIEFSNHDESVLLRVHFIPNKSKLDNTLSLKPSIRELGFINNEESNTLRTHFEFNNVKVVV